MSEITEAIYCIMQRHIRLNGHTADIVTITDFYASIRTRQVNAVKLRNQMYRDMTEQGITRARISRSFGIPPSRVRDELLKEKKKERMLTKKLN
jgi:hypothetical protein